jgi:hypothetical protein
MELLGDPSELPDGEVGQRVGECLRAGRLEHAAPGPVGTEARAGCQVLALALAELGRIVRNRA